MEQLCHQVLVLHRGKLIRDITMDPAHSGNQGTVRLRASIAMNEKLLAPHLKALPCVRRIKILPTMDTQVTEVSMECDATGEEDPQTQLFRLLCALNAPIRMLTSEQDSLESIFLRITAGDGEEAVL